MKVTLVSMPWKSYASPSLALGLLSAYLKEKDPKIAVDCRHEHVVVFSRLEEEFYKIERSESPLSELFYLGHLYPERKSAVRSILVPSTSSDSNVLRSMDEDKYKRIEKKGTLTFESSQFERVMEVTGHHLHELATPLSKDVDVLGLSATFNQVFSSMCLLKLVKEQNPKIVTVMGGLTSEDMGRSLLMEYPFLDYVILGEGERRFHHLLQELMAGRNKFDVSSWILSKENTRTSKKTTGETQLQEWEIKNLDELPYPDFEQYFQQAEMISVAVNIPIEGSRGCAWDQRAKSGDPKRACYFCGSNRWTSRREKSSKRIADELSYLSRKYQTVGAIFVDDLIPQQGKKELAEQLKRTGANYRIVMELRADVKSHQLMALSEAGCKVVQTGIEGLSTKYLKRMNKGTSTIQNLYVMRSCQELEIKNGAGLITHFPGTTEEEIAEIAKNIRQFAWSYEPLVPSPFFIDPNSMVHQCPEKFGIQRIRLGKEFREALPEDVAGRICLRHFEHLPDDKQDWHLVLEAHADWKKAYLKFKEQVTPDFRAPLVYYDGVSFLEIRDERGELQVVTLYDLEQDLYLFCTEIRSLSMLWARYKGCNNLTTILADLVNARLMYEENGQYLSLAVAPTVEIAKKRIREFYPMLG